jgi:hypothetical protein
LQRNFNNPGIDLNHINTKWREVMGKETVLGRVELHAVFGSEELKYRSEVSRHD